MFDTFLESTILMFVAIDPISLVPIFAGLTTGLTKEQVRSIYLRASAVSLASYLHFGYLVMQFLML